MSIYIHIGTKPSAAAVLTNISSLKRDPRLSPHYNNNNESISKFTSEFSPIVDILQKENNYAVIVGDFNINLLQINEQSGRSPKVVALFSATNFSYVIELLQLHDTIQIKMKSCMISI